MKKMKQAAAALVITLVVGSSLTGCVGDKPKTQSTAIPYPMTTCVVSDEKLGGSMGEPYVFVYEGREIKMCCKSCLKDFNKEPAKYIKKIEEAEAKAKTGAKS